MNITIVLSRNITDIIHGDGILTTAASTISKPGMKLPLFIIRATNPGMVSIFITISNKYGGIMLQQMSDEKAQLIQELTKTRQLCQKLSALL